VENGSSPNGRFVDYGFFAALVLAGYLFFRTVESVLVPVVLGAFAAVLARSTADSVARRLRGHQRIAAGVTTTLVVILVLIPAVFLGIVLVQEVVHVAEKLAMLLDKDGLQGLMSELRVPRRIRVHIQAEQLRALANTMAARVGSFATHLVGLAASLFVGMFLFVVSLYYFLVDGKRWLSDVARLMPMRSRYVRAFAREFDSVSHALFYGSLLTALVQGAIAAVGYLIFGVDQPVLWGAATAILSLTPIVGTTIVWLPIGIYLLSTGATGAGIGIIAWNAVITGTIDNVVRPLFMRGRMRLHPLIVFLSLIGGVAAFGMVGLLFGPLAAALFLAGIRIYEHDFRARLDPEAHPPAPAAP
jgi:predicted PurR-regulated permease PerM